MILLQQTKLLQNRSSCSRFCAQLIRLENRKLCQLLKIFFFGISWIRWKFIFQKLIWKIFSPIFSDFFRKFWNVDKISKKISKFRKKIKILGKSIFFRVFFKIFKIFDNHEISIFWKYFFKKLQILRFLVFWSSWLPIAWL